MKIERGVQDAVCVSFTIKPNGWQLKAGRSPNGSNRGFHFFPQQFPAGREQLGRAEVVDLRALPRI